MAKHNEEAINGKSDPINSNKSKQNQTLVFGEKAKPEHLEKKLLKTRASTNLTHVGCQVFSCPFIVPLVNVR